MQQVLLKADSPVLETCTTSKTHEQHQKNPDVVRTQLVTRGSPHLKADTLNFFFDATVCNSHEFPYLEGININIDVVKLFWKEHPDVNLDTFGVVFSLWAYDVCSESWCHLANDNLNASFWNSRPIFINGTASLTLELFTSATVQKLHLPALNRKIEPTRFRLLVEKYHTGLANVLTVSAVFRVTDDHCRFHRRLRNRKASKQRFQRRTTGCHGTLVTVLTPNYLMSHLKRESMSSIQELIVPDLIERQWRAALIDEALEIHLPSIIPLSIWRIILGLSIPELKTYFTLDALSSLTYTSQNFWTLEYHERVGMTSVCRFFTHDDCLLGY